MQSSLDLASKRRALWQAAVGVNAIGDTYVANRGNAGCLAEGTPAHRDAIELTEACRQLAADFERLGERTLARQAVDLRGSLVTRLLGQCMGRVGEVMLESARWAVGANERERAAELCQAVVLDFARLVDAWQPLAEAPRDEVRLALEHLGHAIELRESLGFTSDDERALRRNCAAVLART